MILLLQIDSTKNTCRVHHVELFLLSFGSGKQKHLTQKNLYRMVACWVKEAFNMIHGNLRYLRVPFEEIRPYSRVINHNDPLIKASQPLLPALQLGNLRMPRHKASAVKPVMAGKSKPAPLEQAIFGKGGTNQSFRGQQLFRGGKIQNLNLQPLREKNNFDELYYRVSMDISAYRTTLGTILETFLPWTPICGSYWDVHGSDRNYT